MGGLEGGFAQPPSSCKGPPPSPAVPARSGAKGTGKGKQPCYGYREGNCTRGDACPYAHDKVLSPDEIKAVREKRSKTPCRGFMSGKCKFGDSCQYSHAEGPKPAAACARLEPEERAKVGDNGDDPVGVDVVAISVPAFGRADAVVKEWIVDTGTENHLISLKHCESDYGESYPADRPLRLATANGVVVADRRIKKSVKGLNTVIDPLVLPETVDALSVGRLVVDHQYSFHWPAGGDAYLVDSSGRRTV